MRATTPQHHLQPTPSLVPDERSTSPDALKPDPGVSEQSAENLTNQAARCRRLARATTDAAASKILGEMALDYAATAAKLTAAG